MAPKQLSGYEKRKRKIEEDKKKQSQAGAILKFFNKPTSEEKEYVQVNLEETEGQEHIEEQEAEKEEHDETNINEEDVIHNLVDIFDPRRWERLNSDEIKLLVEKGPKRDNNIVFGPKTKKRRFSATFYTRTLSNLEKCDRPWLVYSKELDKIFCFCCKIFRKGHPYGGLDGKGYNNWLHAPEALRNHEITPIHLENMTKWYDMRKRLKLNETIDKIQYEQLKKERDYWMQVLLRIIAVVKFLAKHSLAFRGSKEKLYQKGNGNFLGLIEMLEEFDPVIKEHVRRITNDEVYVHYLGHKIQNELIIMLGEEVKKQIIKEVKAAKYYSIILDCTPDSSNQEQMSMIVRYVKSTSNSVIVEESFLGFLNVKDTTGKGLFEITLEELKCIGLDPVFPRKRLIHRKKRFDESSSSQEVSFTPEEAFRVNYFLYIVDTAILSLETRFDQFTTYEKLFGFLFPHKLRGIENTYLKSSCDSLKNALRYKGISDISGHELYMELNSFDIIGAGEFKNPLDVLMHLNEAHENFPNARIAYRILLTIPVTVASAERSFSKLKLLKSYLRSTMSQQRLSGLAMLTIENEVLESINCEEVIKQFATKNARRASRIIC